MIKLYRLPIKPLSVNETIAWSRKSQRFIKTKKAKKYLDDLLLILPRMPIPNTELLLIATFGLSSSSSDTDNCIKPFQDALQAKYGFNDRRVKLYLIEGEATKKGQEFIEFTLTEKLNLKNILLLASCSKVL